MASTQRLGLLPPGQAGRQTEKARMEARKHCEEALEAFLLCLPSWRGGQRDNGSCMRSPSPAHQNSVKPKTEKQQAKQTHKEASKSKSRSRSRKRRRKEKEKKEKGVRRRDRSRSRSKERSRSPETAKDSAFSAAPPPAAPTRVEAVVPSLSQLALRPHLPKSSPAPPTAISAAVPVATVPDWVADLVQGNNTASHREVFVPQTCVSRLIGRGGETITAICNQSGADVKIRQETKELGYSIAVLTGRPEGVELAERLVMEKLVPVGHPVPGR